jgi:hypothetical protein
LTRAPNEQPLRTEQLELVLLLHIPCGVSQFLTTALDVFADAGYGVARAERENRKDDCCKSERGVHRCSPIRGNSIALRISQQRSACLLVRYHASVAGDPRALYSAYRTIARLCSEAMNETAVQFENLPRAEAAGQPDD